MSEFISFPEAFSTIVRNHPDNIAIRTDGAHNVTYRALDKEIRALAAAISAFKNAGRIAIALPKSTDYIAAMLACWHTGAHFIPLDPDLPQERRDFILQEAMPDIIVTRKQDASNFKNSETVFIEEALEGDVPTADIKADDTAYIIYTSGSTGVPKGVIVPHRGLVSMLKAQIAAFGLNTNSISLLYLSTAFDASISDIGTTLLAGGCLCIESGGKIDTAAQLMRIIGNRGVTYADLPPSLLRLVNPAEAPACLETIVIGGEPCPPDTVRAWAQTVNLINVYGPTEATICTSLCRCDPDTWKDPLIGTPLPGVEYIISDEGELLIGGQQLAIGYLNRNGLTAEKFIYIGGERFYRSGDRVCRNDNGDLVFLGRIDRQFKLNGQLIEPQEIERHILSIPSITRAAVCKRTVNNRHTLAAFIVGNKSTAEKLRPSLANTLPGWMIPAHVVLLDKMPETASGKPDFKALETIALNNDAKVIEFPFIPRNELEKKLLSCWQKTLNRTRFDENEPFLAAGGDSFSILSLSLAAEKEGLRLSPADIVAYPTLSQQARLQNLISTNKGKMPAVELRQRAALHLSAPKKANPAPLNNILITGAAGYIGNMLLKEILQKNNDVHITAIIRAENDLTALKRLNLEEGRASRVTALAGDLTSPDFGIGSAAYRHLTESIDTVIHGAATVNMIASFDELAPANLLATQEILKFCLTGVSKKLHYLSTLSVFVSSDQNTGSALEADQLDGVNDVYGGYAQTKFAAEYAVRSHTNLLPETAIYRLGLVTGTTNGASFPAHDYIGMFVRALETERLLPEGEHDKLMVDVTPADYAADALAHLVLASARGTFHLANKHGFSLAQIHARLQACGINLKTVSRDTWKKRQDDESGRILYPALCRLLENADFERLRAFDLFQATGISFDTQRADGILHPAGIYHPPADDNLLDLYLKNYLKR